MQIHEKVNYHISIPNQFLDAIFGDFHLVRDNLGVSNEMRTLQILIGSLVGTRMSQEVSKWLVNGLFHLLINGIY